MIAGFDFLVGRVPVIVNMCQMFSNLDFIMLAYDFFVAKNEGHIELFWMVLAEFLCA